MKNIAWILLIIGSIGLFFGYIKPGFATTSDLRRELGVYNDTLKQVEELEAQIKLLQGQIGVIDPKDVARLGKLLPKTVNNVNLIIDINNVASNFGLAPRNIEIDDIAEEGKSEKSREANLYNSLDFSFSVTSTYPNFMNFMNALEKSLRLVDVTAISFTPGEKNEYDFKITLRTYWLK